MKNVLLSLAIVALALPAMADNIRLGYPAYNGTGCPRGSASVALSPDARSLSILFGDFMLEAGQGTGKRLDRKNCDIAIPVHVPQGLSVSVINVDYRGFLDLPRSAMARFSAEYFFAGTRGPSYQKTFRGQTTRNYTIRNNLVASAVTWSRCGQDVNLRANTSMYVRASRGTAFATVDSADVSAGLVYSLQWKRC